MMPSVDVIRNVTIKSKAMASTTPRPRSIG